MIKRYLSDDTNIAIPKRSGRELACLAEYQVFTRIFLLNVFFVSKDQWSWNNDPEHQNTHNVPKGREC